MSSNAWLFEPRRVVIPSTVGPTIFPGSGLNQSPTDGALLLPLMIVSL